MTARFNSFTVVLENNIREDDAETLMSAIMMMKGVISVNGNISNDISEHIAQMRVKIELKNRLFEFASSL